MSILKQIIKQNSKSNSRGRSSKGSFNQLIIEHLKEQKVMTYDDMMELNLKYRVEREYGEVLDEDNAKHVKYLMDNITSIKKIIDTVISRSQNTTQFNFWAIKNDIEVRLTWNKAKTEIKLINKYLWTEKPPTRGQNMADTTSHYGIEINEAQLLEIAEVMDEPIEINGTKLLGMAKVVDEPIEDAEVIEDINIEDDINLEYIEDINIEYIEDIDIDIEELAIEDVDIEELEMEEIA